jgi:hypothetical protein
MKFSRKIRISLAIALAVAGLGSFISGGEAGAVGISGGATQQVQVVVPAVQLAVHITSPADGSTTTTASVSIGITADGPIGSVITVRDSSGTMIGTYTKTKDGPESFTISGQLSGGVGSHQITATISLNGSSASDNITIIWNAVQPPIPPIIPPVGPTAPNTGFAVRFGDYLVPLNYVISYFVYFLAIAGALWFIIAKRRKHQDEEGTEASAEISRK